MSTEYSIVIVAHEESFNFLRLALQQHLESSVIPKEIIVIDNNSPRFLFELLQPEFPQVEVIRLPQNNGYASGANYGIDKAATDFVFLCNPDFFAHKSAANQLLYEISMQSNSAGVAAPLLFNPDGSPQPSWRKFPRDKFFRTLMAGRLHCQYIDHLNSEHSQNSHRTISIEWAMGCALMIRKSAWKQVGGFDSRYFLYFEEIDFQKRILENSWQVIGCPSATGVHIWKRRNRYDYLHKIYWYRSLFLYYKTHLWKRN